MKKIKRGLLLNLEYEGSYIAWKLLLFCVLFYVIQICVGYALVSEKAKVIYAIDGYGTVGFLRYNELFNHSIMPYIFTVFIVASFFGVY